MNKKQSSKPVLNSSNNKLESERFELNSLESALIDTVSGGLRTPLNVMLGYASLLHGGALGTLSPEQQHAMSSIVNRVDEMRELVERINILMEAEAGKGSLSKTALEEIVQEIIKNKEQAANEAGISLITTIMPDLATILGNKNQLQQAIISFLDNAIQCTPNGGQVNISITSDMRWVYFEVSDTGIGIEQKSLEKLNAFFSHNHKTRNQRSTMHGLGFAIARSVVDRHAGHIMVESEFGIGSRFTLKIPIDHVSTEELLDKETSSKKHILLVDDDKNILITLKDILQKNPNYEILTSTSSEEALKLFAYHSFDLAVTDFKMPKMNGIELTKAFRALKPSTKVIWLSAHSDKMLSEQAVQLDVHSFLTKPIEMSEIRNRIQDALTLPL